MILYNVPLPKTYTEHMAFGESIFKFSDVLAKRHFRTDLDQRTGSHVFLLCPCTWESSQVIDVRLWTKDSHVACDICHRVFTDTDLDLYALSCYILGTQPDFRVAYQSLYSGFRTPTYIDTTTSIAFDTVTIVNNTTRPRPSLMVDTLVLDLMRASETKVYFKLAHFKNTLTFNFERKVLYLSAYRSGSALAELYQKPIAASTRPVSFVRNVTFSSHLESYMCKVLYDAELLQAILTGCLSFQKDVAARLGIALPQSLSSNLSNGRTSVAMYSDQVFLNHAAIVVSLNPENTRLLNDAIGFDALDTLTALFIKQANACRADARGIAEPARTIIADTLRLVHCPIQTSVRNLVKLRYRNFSKANIKHFIKYFIPQSLQDFDRYLAAKAQEDLLEQAFVKIQLRQVLTLCDQPQVINAILTEQSVPQASVFSRFNRFETRNARHPIRVRRAFSTFCTRMLLVPRPTHENMIENDYCGSDLLRSLDGHFCKLRSIKHARDRNAGYDALTQFLLSTTAKTLTALERKVNDFITSQNLANPSLLAILTRGDVKDFKYSESDHAQYEQTVGTTVFSLPKTGADLVVTGQDLSICVGGEFYQQRVLHNQTRIIFANDPSLNDKLVIELDIASNEIMQVKSRFNEPMSKIDNPQVAQNLNNYFKQLKVAINTSDFTVPEPNYHEAVA